MKRGGHKRKYGNRAMYLLARKRQHERRELFAAMRFQSVLKQLVRVQ